MLSFISENSHLGEETKEDTKGEKTAFVIFLSYQTLEILFLQNFQPYFLKIISKIFCYVHQDFGGLFKMKQTYQSLPTLYLSLSVKHFL